MAKYKVGLVLSGGGAWGFAHIGLIRALEERGIVPDIIAGTSIGAIIGAGYADGHTADDLLQIVSHVHMSRFATIHLPTKGLLELTWLEKLLQSVLRAPTFEALKTPLVVAATNLSKGEIVHFRTGTLIDKVIASASVPVIFTPREIDGDEYVDGGLLDNFPVMAICDECEQVIGMHVQPKHYGEKLTNLLHIAAQSFLLSVRMQGCMQAHLCDVFIEPDLAGYRFFDFSDSKKIAQSGYDAARKAFSCFVV
ncbi:MAG: patatin-like phospholipase family protein [Prevotellaceae bacterium]|jgi:NTE family protein|nr:patatin-like phospholipase family protein [Prevotellaceae bacterium]